MNRFFTLYGASLLQNIFEHIYISLSSLLLGVVFALSIGTMISLNRNLSKAVINVASILQTIPSLALLAMMIPILGIGKLPAVLALFLYSLLPILRNTTIGLNGVAFDIVDAAKGMGMTRWQVLSKVKLPLAAPVIMSGIRLSGVYVISWTTLAAYIGAGGLGEFILNGLNVYSPPMIIAGTIPVTILAVIMDLLLSRLEKKTAFHISNIRE